MSADLIEVLDAVLAPGLLAADALHRMNCPEVSVGSVMYAHLHASWTAHRREADQAWENISARWQMELWQQGGMMPTLALRMRGAC